MIRYDVIRYHKRQEPGKGEEGRGGDERKREGGGWRCCSGALLHCYRGREEGREGEGGARCTREKVLLFCMWTNHPTMTRGVALRTLLDARDDSKATRSRSLPTLLVPFRKCSPCVTLLVFNTLGEMIAWWGWRALYLLVCLACEETTKTLQFAVSCSSF